MGYGRAVTWMKPLATLVLVAVAAACSREPPARPPPAAAAAPTVAALPAALVPGFQLGPVRIGMDRPTVTSIDLPLRGNGAGPVVNVGPYEVTFGSGERVEGVSALVRDLAGGLRVGERVIPATVTAEELRAALPGCGAPEARIGGEVTACAGGLVLVKRAGPRLAGPYVSVVRSAQRPGG